MLSTRVRNIEAGRGGGDVVKCESQMLGSRIPDGLPFSHGFAKEPALLDKRAINHLIAEGPLGA